MHFCICYLVSKILKIASLNIFSRIFVFDKMQNLIYLQRIVLRYKLYKGTENVISFFRNCGHTVGSYWHCNTFLGQHQNL